MADGTIHDRVKEKVELALFYAEDGAFMTAARKLREAADEMERHANAVFAAESAA